MLALALKTDDRGQRAGLWRRGGPVVIGKGKPATMSSNDDSDGLDAGELIVRIAKNRDRAAFRTLFEIYAPRLKAYLIRQGASPERAEDLAQDALLKVWRKASYYDPARASASAWLFTVARNLRIDALRRENSAMAYALSVREPEANEKTPEKESLLAERARRIRAAVRNLPVEQLDVIRLSFFEDKPHAEIAEQLSLPLGTVKSRVRLAMTRLRGLVGDLS